MRRTTVTRFGLPIAAGLVTSIVVAAFALAAGPPANPGPPTPAGQPVGQLVINGKTISVLSFSEGVSNPSTIAVGGGSGAGKASFSSLNLMTTAGANTPDLHAAVAAGTHFPTAVMTATWVSGGASVSLKYELENILITSDQVSGSGGGQAPLESVSIDFAKVKWTYTDANGAVSRGWDIVGNTGS